MDMDGKFHLLGEEGIKNGPEAKVYRCEPCNFESIHAPSFYRHRKGKTHLERMAALETQGISNG